ncbi:MAG: hypothetical protein ABH869_04205, partial [Candidatus Omnitrophota bacterium]
EAIAQKAVVETEARKTALISTEKSDSSVVSHEIIKKESRLFRVQQAMYSFSINMAAEMSGLVNYLSLRIGGLYIAFTEFFAGLFKSTRFSQAELLNALKRVGTDKTTGKAVRKFFTNDKLEYFKTRAKESSVTTETIGGTEVLVVKDNLKDVAAGYHLPSDSEDNKLIVVVNSYEKFWEALMKPFTKEQEKTITRELVEEEIKFHEVRENFHQEEIKTKRKKKILSEEELREAHFLASRDQALKYYRPELGGLTPYHYSEIMSMSVKDLWKLKNENREWHIKLLQKFKDEASEADAQLADSQYGKYNRIFQKKINDLLREKDKAFQKKINKGKKRFSKKCKNRFKEIFGKTSAVMESGLENLISKISDKTAKELPCTRGLPLKRAGPGLKSLEGEQIANDVVVSGTDDNTDYEDLLKNANFFESDNISNEIGKLGDGVKKRYARILKEICSWTDGEFTKIRFVQNAQRAVYFDVSDKAVICIDISLINSSEFIIDGYEDEISEIFEMTDSKKLEGIAKNKNGEYPKIIQLAAQKKVGISLSVGMEDIKEEIKKNVKSTNIEDLQKTINRKDKNKTIKITARARLFFLNKINENKEVLSSLINESVQFAREYRKIENEPDEIKNRNAILSAIERFYYNTQEKREQLLTALSRFGCESGDYYRLLSAVQKMADTDFIGKQAQLEKLKGGILKARKAIPVFDEKWGEMLDLEEVYEDAKQGAVSKQKFLGAFHEDGAKIWDELIEKNLIESTEDGTKATIIASDEQIKEKLKERDEEKKNHIIDNLRKAQDPDVNEKLRKLEKANFEVCKLAASIDNSEFLGFKLFKNRRYSRRRWFFDSKEKHKYRVYIGGVIEKLAEKYRSCRNQELNRIQAILLKNDVDYFIDSLLADVVDNMSKEERQQLLNEINKKRKKRKKRKLTETDLKNCLLLCQEDFYSDLKKGKINALGEKLKEKMDQCRDYTLKQLFTQPGNIFDENNANHKEFITKGAGLFLLGILMIKGYAVKGQELRVFAGIRMAMGDLVEFPTGEGKTSTNVLALFLKALNPEGMPVFSVETTNALAKRNASEKGEGMGKVYEFLLGTDFKVRHIEVGFDQDEKLKDAFKNPGIVYVSVAHLGFILQPQTKEDAKRIFGKCYNEKTGKIDLYYLAIDEVDEVLLDHFDTDYVIAEFGKVLEENTSEYNLVRNFGAFARILGEEDIKGLVDIDELQIRRTRVMTEHEKILAKTRKPICTIDKNNRRVILTRHGKKILETLFLTFGARTGADTYEEFERNANFAMTAEFARKVKVQFDIVEDKHGNVSAKLKDISQTRNDRREEDIGEYIDGKVQEYLEKTVQHGKKCKIMGKNRTKSRKSGKDIMDSSRDFSGDTGTLTLEQIEAEMKSNFNKGRDKLKQIPRQYERTIITGRSENYLTSEELYDKHNDRIRESRDHDNNPVLLVCQHGGDAYQAYEDVIENSGVPEENIIPVFSDDDVARAEKFGGLPGFFAIATVIIGRGRNVAIAEWIKGRDILREIIANKTGENSLERACAEESMVIICDLIQTLSDKYREIDSLGEYSKERLLLIADLRSAIEDLAELLELNFKTAQSERINAEKKLADAEAELRKVLRKKGAAKFAYEAELKDVKDKLKGDTEFRDAVKKVNDCRQDLKNTLGAVSEDYELNKELFEAEKEKASAIHNDDFDKANKIETKISAIKSERDDNFKNKIKELDVSTAEKDEKKLAQYFLHAYQIIFTGCVHGLQLEQREMKTKRLSDQVGGRPARVKDPGSKRISRDLGVPDVLDPEKRDSDSDVLTNLLPGLKNQGGQYEPWYKKLYYRYGRTGADIADYADEYVTEAVRIKRIALHFAKKKLRNQIENLKKETDRNNTEAIRLAENRLEKIRKRYTTISDLLENLTKFGNKKNEETKRIKNAISETEQKMKLEIVKMDEQKVRIEIKQEKLRGESVYTNRKKELDDEIKVLTIGIDQLKYELSLVPKEGQEKDKTLAVIAPEETPEISRILKNRETEVNRQLDFYYELAQRTRDNVSSVRRTLRARLTTAMCMESLRQLLKWEKSEKSLTVEGKEREVTQIRDGKSERVIFTLCSKNTVNDIVDKIFDKVFRKKGAKEKTLWKKLTAFAERAQRFFDKGVGKTKEDRLKQVKLFRIMFAIVLGTDKSDRIINITLENAGYSKKLESIAENKREFRKALTRLKKDLKNVLANNTEVDKRNIESIQGVLRSDKIKSEQNLMGQYEAATNTANIAGKTRDFTRTLKKRAHKFFRKYSKHFAEAFVTEAIKENQDKMPDAKRAERLTDSELRDGIKDAVNSLKDSKEKWFVRAGQWIAEKTGYIKIKQRPARSIMAEVGVARDGEIPRLLLDKPVQIDSESVRQTQLESGQHPDWTSGKHTIINFGTEYEVVSEDADSPSTKENFNEQNQQFPIKQTKKDTEKGHTKTAAQIDTAIKEAFDMIEKDEKAASQKEDTGSAQPEKLIALAVSAPSPVPDKAPVPPTPACPYFVHIPAKREEEKVTNLDFYKKIADFAKKEKIEENAHLIVTETDDIIDNGKKVTVPVRMIAVYKKEGISIVREISIGRETRDITEGACWKTLTNMPGVNNGQVILFVGDKVKRGQRTISKLIEDAKSEVKTDKVVVLGINSADPKKDTQQKNFRITVDSAGYEAEQAIVKDLLRINPDISEQDIFGQLNELSQKTNLAAYNRLYRDSEGNEQSRRRIAEEKGGWINVQDAGTGKFSREFIRYSNRLNQWKNAAKGESKIFPGLDLPIPMGGSQGLSSPASTVVSDKDPLLGDFVPFGEGETGGISNDKISINFSENEAVLSIGEAEFSETFIRDFFAKQPVALPIRKTNKLKEFFANIFMPILQWASLSPNPWIRWTILTVSVMSIIGVLITPLIGAGLAGVGIVAGVAVLSVPMMVLLESLWQNIYTSSQPFPVKIVSVVIIMCASIAVIAGAIIPLFGMIGFFMSSFYSTTLAGLGLMNWFVFGVPTFFLIKNNFSWIKEKVTKRFDRKKEKTLEVSDKIHGFEAIRAAENDEEKKQIARKILSKQCGLPGNKIKTALVDIFVSAAAAKKGIIDKNIDNLIAQARKKIKTLKEQKKNDPDIIAKHYEFLLALYYHKLLLKGADKNRIQAEIAITGNELLEFSEKGINGNKTYRVNEKNLSGEVKTAAKTALGEDKGWFKKSWEFVRGKSPEKISIEKMNELRVILAKIAIEEKNREEALRNAKKLSFPRKRESRILGFHLPWIVRSSRTMTKEEEVRQKLLNEIAVHAKDFKDSKIKAPESYAVPFLKWSIKNLSGFIFAFVLIYKTDLGAGMISRTITMMKFIAAPKFIAIAVAVGIIALLVDKVFLPGWAWIWAGHNARVLNETAKKADDLYLKEKFDNSAEQIYEFRKTLFSNKFIKFIRAIILLIAMTYLFRRTCAKWMPQVVLTRLAGISQWLGLGVLGNYQGILTIMVIAIMAVALVKQIYLLSKTLLDKFYKSKFKDLSKQEQKLLKKHPFGKVSVFILGFSGILFLASGAFRIFSSTALLKIITDNIVPYIVAQPLISPIVAIFVRIAGIVSAEFFIMFLSLSMVLGVLVVKKLSNIFYPDFKGLPNRIQYHVDGIMLAEDEDSKKTHKEALERIFKVLDQTRNKNKLKQMCEFGDDSDKDIWFKFQISHLQYLLVHEKDDAKTKDTLANVLADVNEYIEKQGGWLELIQSDKTKDEKLFAFANILLNVPDEKSPKNRIELLGKISERFEKKELLEFQNEEQVRPQERAPTLDGEVRGQETAPTANFEAYIEKQQTGINGPQISDWQFERELRIRRLKKLISLLEKLGSERESKKTKTENLKEEIKALDKSKPDPVSSLEKKAPPEEKILTPDERIEKAKKAILIEKVRKKDPDYKELGKQYHVLGAAYKEKSGDKAGGEDMRLAEFYLFQAQNSLVYLARKKNYVKRFYSGFKTVLKEESLYRG